MAFIDTLERLDRRWIFLIMGVLVLFPLMFPLALPLKVTPPVKGFFDTVEKIPNGSTILMSCDYDPGAIPELVPMTRTAFRQLMNKDCKVVITVLWNGGPGLVDSIVTETAREFPTKKYGVDYCDRSVSMYEAAGRAVAKMKG